MQLSQQQICSDQAAAMPALVRLVIAHLDEGCCTGHQEGVGKHGQHARTVSGCLMEDRLYHFLQCRAQQVPAAATAAY